MGVERLDPLIVERLNLNLPGGLDIQFRQGYGKGLRNCVIENATLVENILETQFACNISIRGKYKSSGKLLMFPIDGDGDASMKCKNVRFFTKLTLKTEMGEDGKKHLLITDVKTNHKFDGRITYNFTNIFKRSPETSKLVMAFMNENWRMVADEFGDPVVNFGVNRILKNVKQAFKMVPLDELLNFPLQF
ncbi:unnamed protein product [Diatraea saccharalis]|uniref:Uncharacterized protein n=1 Tax=Diatraea saccharalis TaxID=40085 RepID=A0A9P0G2M7_9NEOP|nr:unnamed protein product [Diatraea saccharalis]